MRQAPQDLPSGRPRPERPAPIHSRRRTSTSWTRRSRHRHDGRCGGAVCGIARPTAIGRRLRGTIPVSRRPAAPRPGRTPVIRWLAGSGSHRRPASGTSSRYSPRHARLRPPLPHPLRRAAATPRCRRRSWTPLPHCSPRAGRPVAIGAAAPSGAAGSGPTAITDDAIDAVAERTPASSRPSRVLLSSTSPNGSSGRKSNA